MTREQFERTIKQMQSEGVPLSMANLLVRTELPRAQIQEWLDDMQRDAKDLLPKPKPKEQAEAQNEAKTTTKAKSDIVQRAKGLQSELVGEAVKSKLGLATKTDDTARPLAKSGLVGLVFPPAGLAYSAPWKTAAAGTGIYLLMLLALFKIPLIGGLLWPLIPLVHVLGAIASMGYAWRFNRHGKRTDLLPPPESK